ncbi:transmembrane protease serine 3-like isoform X1 [Lethenteron reissneri]|uniref:transmembrane protease serine 3-like isoform X1 n=1 Tax=Lethenteron reissneri TaxID=7753 RepID=UPI002AB76042|nr:transmembrane protease serine 3-like isoform X1 [Lethenteron reissneri]XP_061432837.1 transmembrane protease serine 3-like isoform X1 [Lethenteron reissneri]XP_061432838.1 transmembrane protease serine 3-like isoform X1 [Lethenteron reissneri]XP_061432839.1 transmembrane protease serine 3-like isoform X1 [Lethenteron reissneri]
MDMAERPPPATVLPHERPRPQRNANTQPRPPLAPCLTPCLAPCPPPPPLPVSPRPPRVSPRRSARRQKRALQRRLLCAVIVVLSMAAVGVGIFLAVYYLYYKQTAACAFGNCGEPAINRSIMAVSCDGTRNTVASSCMRVWDSTHVLQVFVPGPHGPWGFVCSDGWSGALSRYSCSNMGYNSVEGAEAVDVATLGLNSSSTFLRADPAVNPDSTTATVAKLFQTWETCGTGKVITLQCLACGVGAPLDSSRVVGGRPAAGGRWPWQVSLHYDASLVCGGSIVAPSWVVTAAHCVVHNPLPGLWKAYAGLVEQPSMIAPYLVVDKVYFHSLYDAQSSDYDVALLRLQGPAHFSASVSPVCLPGAEFDSPPGKMCWITGWGRTDEHTNAVSPALQEARVPLLSMALCNSGSYYRGAITPRMVCAGYEQGGIDGCQGDSGGPLVCPGASRWLLTGVTSWGDGCGHARRPGVYSRVSTLLPWLHNVMQTERT